MSTAIIDFPIPAAITEGTNNKSNIVSVFDFDGTLFKSPAPSEHMLAKFPKTTQPTFAGGLGWFQSARTLAPPIVPLIVRPLETSEALKAASSPTSDATAASSSPALPADSFDRWFITPTVAAYTEAKARGDATYILTGREMTFKQRLGDLLSNAGFAFDELFLKRHPRGGTVAFKLDVFMELIVKHQPHSIVYYEDRPEQGQRILEAVVKAIEQRCSAALFEHYVTKGFFKIVFIDPSLSDTLLTAEVEAALAEDLLADAKAEAAKRRAHGHGGGGNGHYGGGRGGGYQGNRRGGGGKSDEHRNRW